jgi:hypothetical protein
MVSAQSLIPCTGQTVRGCFIPLYLVPEVNQSVQIKTDFDDPSQQLRVDSTGKSGCIECGCVDCAPESVSSIFLTTVNVTLCHSGFSYRQSYLLRHRAEEIRFINSQNTPRGRGVTPHTKRPASTWPAIVTDRRATTPAWLPGEDGFCSNHVRSGIFNLTSGSGAEF